MVTPKLAVQVFEGSQVEVTVNVTVVVPPQAFGAPVLLFVNPGLHPPDVFTVANQVANLASIAACV